jgi:myo-inositol-1(or 4)-monophosphatase
MKNLAPGGILALSALCDVAIEASHAAGRALLSRFRGRLEIQEKPGEGIVTNADFAAEKAALKILRKAYPDFAILSEESEPQKGKCPGRFILDPLDGTANFARGFPTFSVSLAVEWNNELVAGVVFHPTTGETYTAIKGKGAFVRDNKGSRPMRVSPTLKLADAFLTTGFSSRQEKWLTEEVRAFERISRAASAVRRPGSAALDLSQVARGVFDGFWERGLRPWDIAAGVILVEEAGGRVTDFSGKKLDLNSGEILGSNGPLHKVLLRELLV